MAEIPKINIITPNVDDPTLQDPLTRRLETTSSPEFQKSWQEAMNNIPVPRPKTYEERPEMIGQKVTVRRCHAREHGDNEGCLCDLVGKEVTISAIYQTPFVGTPSYHIQGSKKRIQEREWVEIEQKYEEGELERVKKVLGKDYVEPEE